MQSGRKIFLRDDSTMYVRVHRYGKRLWISSAIVSSIKGLVFPSALFEERRGMKLCKSISCGPVHDIGVGNSHTRHGGHTGSVYRLTLLPTLANPAPDPG